MARQPRGGSWAAEYRARLELNEREDLSTRQRRGHPGRGELGVKQQREVKEAIRSSPIPPEVVVEGDRVMIRTRDAKGQARVVVVSKDQWARVRPKGKPRKGVDRPKVWQYRKRRRAA